ncbi:hypothetical protein [Roseateles sp.]|uniref:hypothetical protein n=1 Tax=Roseateles sp. TaxID=1971397 RepID=UPI003BAA87DF
MLIKTTALCLVLALALTNAQADETAAAKLEAQKRALEKSQVEALERARAERAFTEALEREQKARSSETLKLRMATEKQSNPCKIKLDLPECKKP